MNRLAAGVPRGADGLRCNPLFTGTRSQPELRGSFEGISVDNFTPAHITRALLEGMARVFAGGAREIEAVEGKPRRQLVGAGNGLRENAVLAECVAHEFGLPLAVPCHREEAAFGAALRRPSDWERSQIARQPPDSFDASASERRAVRRKLSRAPALGG